MNLFFAGTLSSKTSTHMYILYIQVYAHKKYYKLCAAPHNVAASTLQSAPVCCHLFTSVLILNVVLLVVTGFQLISYTHTLAALRVCCVCMCAKRATCNMPHNKHQSVTARSVFAYAACRLLGQLGQLQFGDLK